MLDTIYKLIFVWVLVFIGNILCPLASFAAIYDTTYDTSYTTTTAPTTIAKHTVATRAVPHAETSLRSVASDQSQSLFGQSRSFLATKGGGDKLYRGVGKNHPGYKDATRGTAKPRKPLTGHTDPELHNAGDTKSKFTSWTTDRDVAKTFAGDDGVILETSVPTSKQVPSPDKFCESEVLIKGAVKGAKVTKP